MFISRAHILDEGSKGVRRSRQSPKAGAIRKKLTNGNLEEQSCLGGLPTQDSVYGRRGSHVVFLAASEKVGESEVGGETGPAGGCCCEYKAGLASVYAAEEGHVAHAEQAADPCALASSHLGLHRILPSIETTLSYMEGQ